MPEIFIFKPFYRFGLTTALKGRPPFSSNLTKSKLRQETGLAEATPVPETVVKFSASVILKNASTLLLRMSIQGSVA